ncbi:MAG: Fic family protein [Oribacterium sp.]|nr:Fic family protein [Oribacterium sp.]
MDKSIKEFIWSNRPYFEDFITRCTYHSNRIEGSTISYAETYALIFGDDSFRITATPREIYDAINHKYAMDYMMKTMQEQLTEADIKELARRINRNMDEVSGYRQTRVLIRGAEHIPPAPEQIRQAMMYFVYNYNHTTFDSIYHKMAEMHIQFERIHPFSDGNGRTGRLLLSYELLKNDLPPMVIPSEQRTEYFAFLAKQDIKGLSDFFRELSEQEKERIKGFEASENKADPKQEARASGKAASKR